MLSTSVHHRKLLLAQVRSSSWLCASTMNAASHNILLTAAAEHQLQLLESASFDHFIDMAIKIAQRMQLAGAKPTKSATPDSNGDGAGPSKPKKSKSNRSKKGKPAKFGKDRQARVAVRIPQAAGGARSRLGSRPGGVSRGAQMSS